MAKRSTSRAKARAEKRMQKERSMEQPGGSSNYARKVAWCIANEKAAIDVAEPKPWKS